MYLMTLAWASSGDGDITWEKKVGQHHSSATRVEGVNKRNIIISKKTFKILVKSNSLNLPSISSKYNIKQ